VRDLRGVLERESVAGAIIAVLISMQEPTRNMRREAAAAGLHESRWGKHQRIQLLTVAELLSGKRVDRPPTYSDTTFKRAPKDRSKGDHPELDFS
jgi:hypothetical protein